MSQETLLRMKEVTTITKVSSNTINRWCAAGTFPAPRKIGAHAIAWLSSEVTEWMRSCPPVNCSGEGGKSAG